MSSRSTRFCWPPMRISPASNSTCVLPRLSTISSGTVALPRSVMTSVPFDWPSSKVATLGVAPGSPPCSHTSVRAPWRTTCRGSSVDGVVVPEGSPLFETLAALARDARLVFFAGLPGTGKSLLIHQLAHLAHGRGRHVHLLQWDVARPVFEASRAGRRHPQVHGVTQGVIRLAVGRWARDEIARWDARHPGLDHLLIGETPFIGHRLVELARPAADTAERVLAAATTRFVIPVPSRELRAHLEGERERRAREPRHQREREDAPPAVLPAPLRR